MAGTPGLADRQIDGVADHIHPIQTINLQGFVVGRQPAFLVGCLRRATFPHRIHRANRRRGHEDVIGLCITFFRVGDALVRIDLAEGEAALKLNVLLGKDARQDLAGRTLQEQAIAQQLCGGRVGIDDLDLVTYTAAAQVVIEH
ncbi:hypothetical protein D3C79_834950 [compost metagenome]